MATITTQPTNPQTVQKPILYTVEGVATTKVQVAEITVNPASGNAITVKQEHSLPTGTTFVHDLSGVARDRLNKDLHKTFVFTPFAVRQAQDRTANITVTFTDWDEVTNADGTFLEEGANVAATTVVCINALTTENQLPAAYNKGALPLTKKTKGRFCRGERNIITVWNRGAATCTIRSHTPTGTSDVSVPLVNNALNEINVAHTSYAAADALAIEAIFQDVTIYFKKECCTAALVHFINSFGQVETVAFTRLFSKNKAKSSDFESHLPVDATATDIGAGRYNIKRNVTYEGTLGNVTPEEAEWLFDLMDSPAAVWQVGTKLIPIVIEDGSFEIDVKDGENIFELKFSLARGRAGLV